MLCAASQSAELIYVRREGMIPMAIDKNHDRQPYRQAANNSALRLILIAVRIPRDVLDRINARREKGLGSVVSRLSCKE